MDIFEEIYKCKCGEEYIKITINFYGIYTTSYFTENNNGRLIIPCCTKCKRRFD